MHAWTDRRMHSLFLKDNSFNKVSTPYLKQVFMKKKCTISRLTGKIDEEGRWIRGSENTQDQLATPRQKSGVSDLALRCPLLLHLVQPRDKTSCYLLEEQEEKKLRSQIPAQPETEMLSSEGAGITKAHAARSPGELDKRHTGPSGRSTDRDLPRTSAPRLPIQDPPSGGWHSKVFLGLQNLAQGPEKPEQQCVSQNCQKMPERMGGHVTYDQLHQ